jgi:hypothetical protein
MITVVWITLAVAVGAVWAVAVPERISRIATVRIGDGKLPPGVETSYAKLVGNLRILYMTATYVVLRGRSRARRSQPASVEPRSYVLSTNARNAASGSAAVRTASYGRRNSPSS